ncbi:uncharacterized protein [Rutidosis leptorrhynchoides]|uniref:uncharacterized protein n=1 Tax=Rutidosis leptorrhynchoides TaxID=125765 RepID=UPI003A99B1C6
MSKFDEFDIGDVYEPVSHVTRYHQMIPSLLLESDILWQACFIGKTVSLKQSACIKRIQILDGQLVLSEVISWYKKANQKLMLLKVHFEKACDSVSLGYLNHLLASLGFRDKWRALITG